jgi:hypothetical protein
MRPSFSSPLHAALPVWLVLFTGCGSADPPTRPSIPEPAAVVQTVEPGIPIEVREDAIQVGMMDPISLHAATREGMNIKVSVSYRGGETHRVRALAGTCFYASYPGQIYVFLQHDAAGDASEELVEQEIAYDMRPVFEYFDVENQPFYLRVITPSFRDQDPNGSRMVLIEP